MNPTDQFITYQIRLKGHVDQRWFDSYELDQTAEGETIIQGCFDQSALHGLLHRLRDLGLELISVQRCIENERNHS